jgi:S-formylglutathione hydrolase FrmB
MLRLLVIALLACNRSVPAPAVAPAPEVAPPPAAAVPTSPPATSSKVVTERFASAALGVEKDVRIWLPKGYGGGKRYPVYYFLHGLGGNETNWVDVGHIDQAADELGLEAILVMPDGDSNFYIDSAMSIDFDACMKDGAHLFNLMDPRATACVKRSHYETYLTKDLIGWVDRTFATIPQREGRAIAGLSMGGYGALLLGLRHPDLFSAIVSHSGFNALRYAGPFPYVAGKVTEFDDPARVAAGARDRIVDWMLALYGKDGATWKALDPITYAKQLVPGAMAIYLDCGTEDEFRFQNHTAYLHDVLTSRGIEHAYFVGPGRHNFNFWTPRLPESLGFLRAHVAAARR